MYNPTSLDYTVRGFLLLVQKKDKLGNQRSFYEYVLFTLFTNDNFFEIVTY